MISSLLSALTAKAAAAGIAGVLVAGGTGVAVAQIALPDTPVEVPADLTDVTVPDVTDVTVPEVEVPEIEVPDVTEVPEDDFGAQVSADARGESDGVPGVDGQSIAEQARAQGQARAGDDGTDVDVEVEVSDELRDNFGAQVSADARGESDGVPGVDGRSIAEQARAQGQARAGDDADEDDEDEAEAGVTADSRGRSGR